MNDKRVAIVLLIFAAVLAGGWLIAIVVSWNHIVSSHVRLGYLIADIGLVLPVCVATGLGLRAARAWAGAALQFTLGALAYDAVHFAVYLAQERFLGLGVGAYVAVLAVVLAAVAWLAAWGLRRASPEAGHVTLQ